MRITSLKIKFILLFSVITSLSVLITGLLLVAVYYFSFEKLTERSLRNKTNMLIRDHITAGGGVLYYKKGPEGQNITSRLRDFDVSVVIFDSSLKRIGTYGYYKNLADAGTLEKFLNRDEISSVLSSGKPLYKDAVVSNGILFDVFTAPLTFDGNILGVVQMATQNSVILTLIPTGIWVLLLVLPAMMLISWLSVFLITRYLFQPLNVLVHYMETVTSSYIPPAVEVKNVRSDELKIVSGTFNRMIDRLRDSISKQQSYADHLSHEIKTPLARAVSTIDVVAGEVGKINKSLNSKLLAVRDELLTVGQMADSILSITGNRKITDPGAIRVINVREELEYITGQFDRQIKKKSISMRIECQETVKILFTSDHFRMIAGNIISNAVKYTTNNGEIRVSGIKKDGGRFSLVVFNTGSYISPDDRKTIFQRYKRGSKAGRKIKGQGLGLPLVKELCLMHNLSLNIFSDKGSGTTVATGGFHIGD